VNLARFLAERQDGWQELDELVRRAGRRPEQLGVDGVRRLGALYRSAAADLALARRTFAGDPVVPRLERLVGRARHLVYDAPGPRESIVRFFRRGYWQLVASRPWPLLAAVALLLGPSLLAGAWALDDPGAAGGLVPAEYRSVTEPRPEGTNLGLSGSEQAALSSEIFTNNIRVAFFAFAGGIAAGLVTAAILLFNGVLLGTVAGLATGADNGRSLYELVVPHGVLELSCIAVAGAAGLRLGWALVDPGRHTRADSLREEARRTVAIALGTAPWLVLAGLVEGFVTGAGLGVAGVTIVGFGLGALYWSLILVLGRYPGVRHVSDTSGAGTASLSRSEGEAERL
jgi:uncharacterized membrane protein SpoIIM required for sporulation